MTELAKGGLVTGSDSTPTDALPIGLDSGYILPNRVVRELGIDLSALARLNGDDE